MLLARGMDEAISLDQNGKLPPCAQLVRGMVVAARAGWADTVRAGQFLKILDQHGKRAGDFRAFNAANLDERPSAMHRRVWVNRLCPRPCESYHTKPRRPILPSAPCDEHRYQLYGIQREHANCSCNFRRMMAPFLGDVRRIPQPISLFMNVGVFSDGRVETGGNPSKPGDCVVFKAWVDTVVALSACPQDFNPVADWYPSDLHAGIYEAA